MSSEKPTENIFFLSLCPLKTKQKIYSFCLYVLNYLSLYPQKSVFLSINLSSFCRSPLHQTFILTPSNSLTPALSKILHSFLLFYLFTLLLLNTSITPLTPENTLPPLCRQSEGRCQTLLPSTAAAVCRLQVANHRHEVSPKAAPRAVRTLISVCTTNFQTSLRFMAFHLRLNHCELINGQKQAPRVQCFSSLL